MKRFIPNALTLLNLVIGGSAIVFLFMQETQWVLWCAALCFILDVMDGLAARALNTHSDLGGQLDSLADLVSFGVLPSCVLIELWMGTCTLPAWIVPVAFIYAAAVALRLGKFNLDSRDPVVFYGLPSPSGAMAIFGVLLMYADRHSWIEDTGCQHFLFVGLIVLLSTLLLSNLRLWSLKSYRRPGGPAIFWIMCAIFAGLVLLTGSAAFTLMIGIYLLFGLLNLMIKVY